MWLFGGKRSYSASVYTNSAAIILCFPTFLQGLPHEIVQTSSCAYKGCSVLYCTDADYCHHRRELTHLCLGTFMCNYFP